MTEYVAVIMSCDKNFNKHNYHVNSTAV